VPDLLDGLILLAVGLVAGALNTIAGGGSFLTLPVLIFLGLPATLANGTNRVAIVLQNAGAMWGFHGHKVLDWSWALAASVPATAGAALGAWLALRVGDETFKDLLAVFMVVISLWTLVDPFGADKKKRIDKGKGREAAGARAYGAGNAAGRGEAAEARGEPGSRGVAGVDGAAGEAPTPAIAEAISWREAPPARRWGLTLGFVVVGIYGGFVQAGVGFLVLAATSLAGFDLVRGNAIKGVAIFFLSVLALAIFAAGGQVDWATGLILAAGMVAGSLIGVRLTVLKGHRWVKGVVTAAVIVFAVKLWLD